MAYIYDLADTWNSAGTSFNGIKLNVTDTASAVTSKLLDLQIGGSSKFSISKTGAVAASGIIESTVGGFKFPDGTIQTTRATGTVTSVSGTGTVSGLTLTGSVTTSGSLTLGGTLALTSGEVTSALGYTPYNATNPSGYITASALTPYLTSATAATTYQPLDGDLTAIAALAGTAGIVRKTAANTYTLDTATYLTGITSGQVTTALGFTPYNATNPAGYTTNVGTVTSVSGAGTVSGLTLTGSVTSTGSLTLGGTLALTSGNVTTALGFTPATAAQGAKADTAVQTIASTDGSVTITGTTAIDLSIGVAGSTSNVLLPIRNTTGATLTKGTAVYISGATGQLSTVSKAIATSDATSAQTLGLVTANISNNSNGNVTLIGSITNIDTSAYTDGQQLYLSPTTAGTLTATKPYAPRHLVYVAIVEHAHPSQGKLFVKVQNGYEMDELHDVSAQSPANNDGLFYSTLTNLWEKKSIATALGFTPYNATNPAGYLSSVSLTTNVTGTLPVGSGGSGASTLTGVVIGNGTSAFTTVTAPSGAIVGTTDTQTLTNKRVTSRMNSQTTTTSPWAWNSDSFDVQAFTALANALTINADAGTPTDGQRTILRFKDNGTAQSLTWTIGATKSFRAVGVTLPTTTVIGKTTYVGCVYNIADSRWDAVAVSQEA